MIEIKEISKTFDSIHALQNVTLTIEEGQIFGLVGTNGSGKSTLLRILCGIYKADKGEVLVDGLPVFENPAAKQKIFFLSDNAFFFHDDTPSSAADYYQILYPNFDRKKFRERIALLHLDENRRVRTFSKGMKRQLAIILALSSGAKYLLLDETFDGLDPVVRQAVKGALAEEVYDHKVIPLIASHNIREIEGISDHVGLLHQGGLILSKDLNEAKPDMTKVQCVMNSETDEVTLLSELEVVRHEKQGSMLLMIVKGDRAEVMRKVNMHHPIFSEALPMTLEEIFITEMEVAGYDLRNFNA